MWQGTIGRVQDGQLCESSARVACGFYSRTFPEHAEWVDEVIDGDDARDYIKALVFVRQLRLNVEVSGLEIGQLDVLLELERVHASGRDAAHLPRRDRSQISRGRCGRYTLALVRSQQGMAASVVATSGSTKGELGCTFAGKSAG